MTEIVPRPESDEYAPFYAGYIALAAARSDSIGELVVQRDRVCRGLASMSETEAAYRYAPGKWSVKELVSHLSDAERIFSYRLLRAARGDQTALPGFDENAYARTCGADDRRFGDLIGEWRAVRESTIALVGGLSPAVWEQRVTANQLPISARALYYVLIGHVDHHCRVLAERYGVAI